MEEAYQEWFYHARGIAEDVEGPALEELLAGMDTQGVTSLFCGHADPPKRRAYMKMLQTGVHWRFHL